MTTDSSVRRGAMSSVDYECADDLATLLVSPANEIGHMFVDSPAPEAAPTLMPMVAMLCAVVDTLPGNVFAKDLAGRYVVANAQTEFALGKPRDAILGRTDSEILDDPEEAARLMAADRRVIASGAPESLEEPVTLADGSTVAWLSTKAPLRDRGGNIIGIIGFSIDITERKAAEARLDAVLEALPIGIIVADAEGAIVRDNAATRELWGITPTTVDWRGYGQWVGFDPATGKRLGARDWAMSRALLDGDTVRGELVECERFGSGERRRYLNSAAPVRDPGGKIVGAVVAQLDVTGTSAAGIGRAAH